MEQSRRRALALFLSVSIIGIPFLIEEIHLWNQRYRIVYSESNKPRDKDEVVPPEKDSKT
jgi:hypothetical protein